MKTRLYLSRWRNHRLTLLLTLVLSLGILNPLVGLFPAKVALAAPVLNFNDFSSIAGLTLNGNTAQAGNVLRLAPAARNQKGSAYGTTPMSVTSFQTRFQFFFHDFDQSTSDGMTFVIQNAGVNAIGGGGGDMGYSGFFDKITPSVAVFFEPQSGCGQKVGFAVNGSSVDGCRAGVTPPFNLYGSPVTVWVDYDQPSTTLQVFLAQNTTKPAAPLFTQTIDIKATVGATAFFGFTAATGGGVMHHDLLNWTFFPPTVTINQAGSQADPTNSNPLLFTVIFDRAVSGFTAADVTLSGTANLTGATVTVNAGPTVYSVAVSGVSGSGTVIASINAGVAVDATGADNLASTSTDNTVTVNFDSTGPVITPNVVGTLGNNDWYTSDVNVTWGVVDNESAISNQSGCAAQSITSDTTGVTITCSATSAGGSSSQSVTLKRDATAPTISFVNRVRANSNGWNNSDVIVNWACSDATSGATAPIVVQTVTSEGANQSATGTCADNAGNRASNTQRDINIDKTAPTISAVATSSQNGNGWYNSDVTVHFTCADNLSGVTNCPTDELLNSEGAAVASTAQTITDLAGNSSTPSNVVTVQIDKTAPTISAAATSAPNSNGWYNNDVTIHFTCADSLAGVVSCPADETLSGEGAAVASTAQTITDLAGNSSTPSNVVTVQIDKTAPTISAAATSAPNANGWYNSDAIVHFTCADDLAGVASCPADETLSNEGNAVSSTAQTVSDLAGNQSAASNVVTVQIDKTAPVVTVTGVSNGASYTLGSVPTAGCSTTDALAGVATQATVSVTGGNADGMGSFTATCSGATDNAGNSGSTSATYRVAYNWAGFFQPVDNLPTVNTVNAGAGIPVKFSLSGNFGLNICASGYPVSQNVSCGGGGGGSASPIEETVTAGNSGLQYDPATQSYTYVWKTDKAWAGACRQLIVRLIDGSEHLALFQFNGKARSAGDEGSAVEGTETSVVQQLFLPLVNR